MWLHHREGGEDALDRAGRQAGEGARDDTLGDAGGGGVGTYGSKEGGCY